MRAWLSRRAERDPEKGIVAVWVGILAVVLFGVGAFAVDVAQWAVEGQRLQKAVDNASMAGVVYLPGDEPTAIATAREIAEDNGWDIDGVETTFSANRVADRPTRLQVTMSSEVQNSLGALLGVNTTRVTRTAIADYGSPAAVGNPCNVFGAQVDGDASALTDPSANCTNNANYWLNIAGDNTNKARGDGFGSGWCTDPDDGSGIDNCIGDRTDSDYRGPAPPLGAPPDGINADHTNEAGQKIFEGYLFAVRPKVSGTLNLQGYDLGWVATGDYCTEFNLRGINPTNAFVTSEDEAELRYREGNADDPTVAPYCSGDTLMTFPEGDRARAGADRNGNGTPDRQEFPDGDSGGVITDIAVYSPPPNPWEPLGGTEICSSTLPGWGPSTTEADLATGGDSELARVFHRWASPCTTATSGSPIPPAITPNVTSFPVVAGEDYIIQIQTTNGGGQNRFSLRADVDGNPDNVSIFALDKFSIFVNAKEVTVEGGDQGTQFNLIRLDSSTAGKLLRVRFFDLGDTRGALEVTAQVLNPDGEAFDLCEGQGPIDGGLTACSVTTTASVNGGRWQTIRASIPSDYSCVDDADLTQCWVTLKLTLVDPGESTQSDTTTWTAEVLGDPVRLVDGRPDPS